MYIKFSLRWLPMEIGCTYYISQGCKLRRWGNILLVCFVKGHKCTGSLFPGNAYNLHLHVWLPVSLLPLPAFQCSVCVCACVCVCTRVHACHSVFFPAYLRHVSPASLQHRYFFDVGKERGQMLWCDHRPRPNHTLPSCLDLILGRTLHTEKLFSVQHWKAWNGPGEEASH